MLMTTPRPTFQEIDRTVIGLWRRLEIRRKMNQLADLCLCSNRILLSVNQSKPVVGELVEGNQLATSKTVNLGH